MPDFRIFDTFGHQARRFKVPGKNPFYFLCKACSLAGSLFSAHPDHPLLFGETTRLSTVDTNNFQTTEQIYFSVSKGLGDTG